MSNYRQSTAKALRFRVKNKMNELGRFDNYFIGDKWECRVQEWQPDKDANHRDMVINWLWKQGYTIYISYCNGIRFELEQNEPYKIVADEWHQGSLFTATEKAWEEYNNNK